MEKIDRVAKPSGLLHYPLPLCVAGRESFFSQPILRVFPHLERDCYLNYNSYRSALHPRKRLHKGRE